MKKIIPAIVAMLFLLPSAGSAADGGNGPMITMGIIAMAGSHSIDTNNSGLDSETGFILGGGLLLEKMMSRHFGISTGVQYRYFKNDSEITDTETTPAVTTGVHWEFNAISVPFHIVTSIQGTSSSLNILIGTTYTHIYDSTLTTSESPTGINSDNTKSFLNPNQFAISGGLLFRFLVTEYTDFFMGVMAEYYPTDLLDINDNEDRLHLVNYSFNTGYMFRTDIF